MRLSWDDPVESEVLARIPEGYGIEKDGDGVFVPWWRSDDGRECMWEQGNEDEDQGEVRTKPIGDVVSFPDPRSALNFILKKANQRKRTIRA